MKSIYNAVQVLTLVDAEYVKTNIGGIQTGESFTSVVAMFCTAHFFSRFFYQCFAFFAFKMIGR